MFGRVLVLMAEKILLRRIKLNDISPISEPNTVAIKGRTPVVNKSAMAAMLPSGEPKAFQSDF